MQDDLDRYGSGLVNARFSVVLDTDKDGYLSLLRVRNKSAGIVRILSVTNRVAGRIQPCVVEVPAGEYVEFTLVYEA